MLSCVLLGHRYGFRAEGRDVVWFCRRECGVGGSRRYSSVERAVRYASALDGWNDEPIGRRAPLLGMLPLRLWRALTRLRSG